MAINGLSAAEFVVPAAADVDPRNTANATPTVRPGSLHILFISGHTPNMRSWMGTASFALAEEDYRQVCLLPQGGGILKRSCLHMFPTDNCIGL